jgi:FtsH-binding integral membrane protein
MNSKISITLALVCLGIIYLIVMGIDSPITTKGYIINTYMYILLAIIIVGLTWAFLDNQGDIFYDDYVKHIALIIVFLLSFITILLTPTDYYILNHTAWGLFVVSTGFMTYLTYKNNIANNNMTSVLISLLAIIASMSYIAYTQPLDSFKSWEKPMVYSLGALILVEMLDLLFMNGYTKEFAGRLKIYSWIGLIIFSYMMIIGTQRIIKNSELIVSGCKNKSQIECVDYPKYSLHTILNIVNLFNMVSGTHKSI